jgi:hypothetical protein
MAKNKKRKKTKKAMPTQSLAVRPSKSYLDSCYATARRIIRALGEDESLFDTFTKHLKQDLFRIVITPPYIAAMSGHKVPRSFLQYIQDNLTMCLKRQYFDEENGVTWMEMMTVGEAMLLSSRAELDMGRLPPQQQESVQRLLDAFEAREVQMNSHYEIVSSIKVSLMSLSQPNFRIYGLVSTVPVVLKNRPVFQRILHITTHECQTLRFTYHNKERVAYRVLLGPLDDIPIQGATIAMSKLFPGTKNDRTLDVYIQAHAIHRLKDRIDTVHPVVRNELVILSLAFIQEVIRGVDGRLYIAYLIPDGPNVTRTIGYFAFTIEGNNLLILTFLPLFSPRVPEGHAVKERLHLSKEDVTYLGMDKLSFFYDVDIEQIPKLKEVLFDELHLNYIRHLYSTFRTKGEPFNEKRTSFVKNFFQKLEDRPFDPTDESYTPPLAEMGITEADILPETNILEDD